MSQPKTFREVRRLHVGIGERIDHFAEEVAMFCRRYNCLAEFEFNGTPGVARPGMTPSEIIDAWAAMRDEKAK